MTPVSRQSRFGFTLMELMVAVGLLTGVILGVGMIFQGTSKAVSLSQATSEAFTAVRALNKQIESDVASMDKDGFLVIRSRVDTVDNTRRFDQIAFLAKGSFRNLTGTTANNPFTDRSIANAARIWYGHLVMAGDGVTINYLDPAGAPATATFAGQNSAVPLNMPPTGTNDQDFVLGRQAMLLIPDDGGTASTVSSVSTAANIYALAFRRNAGTNIRYGATILAAETPTQETPLTIIDITSSRVGAAGYTPANIMGWIMANAGMPRAAAAAQLETYNYCYRLRALPNIWNTSITGLNKTVNGYYRTHPIFMSNVPSFQVDWTDGTPYVAGDSIDGVALSATDQRIGSLHWYGLDNRKTAADSLIEPSRTAPVNNGDGYIAQFSFDSKTQWPKALRFTYRVTDPNNRLAGGRTFVQIVALPR